MRIDSHNSIGFFLILIWIIFFIFEIIFIHGEDQAKIKIKNSETKSFLDSGNNIKNVARQGS